MKLAVVDEEADVEICSSPVSSAPARMPDAGDRIGGDLPATGRLEAGSSEHVACEGKSRLSTKKKIGLLVIEAFLVGAIFQFVLIGVYGGPPLRSPFDIATQVAAAGATLLVMSLIPLTVLILMSMAMTGTLWSKWVFIGWSVLIPAIATYSFYGVYTNYSYPPGWL